MTLSRRQFHGTPYQIDDTHIRPSTHTGAPAASSRGFSSGNGRPAHVDLAFATNGEDVAWGYALNTGHRLKDHPSNSDPDPRWRSRVYEVGRAPDQYQPRPHDEIESEVGFPIKGAIMHRAGETGTFPQINWNAFKPRSAASPRHVASDMDLNHSYMQDQSGVEKPARVPKPFDENLEPHENRYRAPDHRDPEQLNLFTGKTVAETDRYVRQPGFMLQAGQFEGHDVADFHRDPTTSTRRAMQPYAKLDREMGTTR